MLVGDLLSVDWMLQPAKLRVGSRGPNGEETVSWEGTATRVIVRHGADGSLGWLKLTPDEITRLRILQKENFSNSLKQIWAQTFYDNSKHFPRSGSIDFLLYHKSLAHRFFAERGGSVAIGRRRQSFYYKVLCESDASLEDLPDKLFNIPIFGERQTSGFYSNRPSAHPDNGLCTSIRSV